MSRETDPQITERLIASLISARFDIGSGQILRFHGNGLHSPLRIRESHVPGIGFALLLGPPAHIVSSVELDLFYFRLL